MRNFSPVSEMRKGQSSWGRVLAPNSRNKANMAKHKNFAPTIATATLKAVSLQLNGMLTKWKIQQAMQYDTGLKCSYGKISSPLTEISVAKTANSIAEPAGPLI